MVYGIIYCITCKLNGKRYIGQTVLRLQERWKNHIHNSRKKKLNSLIDRKIKEYGSDKFLITEVWSRSNTGNKQKDQGRLDQQEGIFIRKLETHVSLRKGYNVSWGGRGKGKHSEVTKQKIRKAKLGKSLPPFSLEHKRRISESNMGKHFHIKSLGTCKKLSLANRGFNNPMFGKNHSPLTISKMRERALKREARKRGD